MALSLQGNSIRPYKQLTSDRNDSSNVKRRASKMSVSKNSSRSRKSFALVMLERTKTMNNSQ